MTINLQLPQKQSLKPSISVFGVGGAGGNAVSNMISSNLEGVHFVVANTDSQALEESICKDHIQLGEAITQGLGAGSYPEVGKASAEESINDILEYLQGCNMVFITAGLGGGTGTGAAPVVARLAREQGILTVAVITKPFHFEGSHRMRIAEAGLDELQKYVDTLIVIPNQNLFRVADKNTTFLEAFKMADDILHCGVRGITDLMTVPGQINLDFSDVRSVMGEMGKAMMGTGEASGENRATEAAEAAIANPLLDNVSMQGARGVLINITGGADMTLFEVDEAANRIREEVDPEANIIFGSAFNKDLEGVVRVSVVATGIEPESHQNEIYSQNSTKKTNNSPADNTSSSPLSSFDFSPALVTPSQGDDNKEFIAPAPMKASAREENSNSTETNSYNSDVSNSGISDNNVSSSGLSNNGSNEDKDNIEDVKSTYKQESLLQQITDNKISAENDQQTEIKIPDILQEQPQKNTGLFGGFFGGSKKQTKSENSLPKISEDSKEETPHSSSRENKKSNDKLSDEDLEIPAFLRRKGK